MEEKQNQKYISLLDAAKLCSYSEPYLRLRARQGKLKSIKLGKKWMTTASWLDDYERRVAEWRDNSELKRSAAGRAVLVAAPQAVEKVMASPDSPASENIAVFCGVSGPAALPPVPNRRKLRGVGGQIFPPPVQKSVGDPAGHGWAMALVSGAAIALLLFAIARPSGILELAGPETYGAGQASAAKPVLVQNDSDFAPAPPEFSLEYFVRAAADFFRGF